MKKPIDKVRVIISMPSYRLEAFMSVVQGLRPLDFLNTESQQFVALTEVKVYDWKGEFIEDKEFMAVNKEKISWITEV